MATSMVHLNHHLLCSMDVETLGSIAGYHEMWQICILPLDNNLDPHQDHVPFDALIRPDNPERYEEDARFVTREGLNKAMLEGIDKEASADLFESWFENLQLPEKKRIVPLGVNFNYFDFPFIKAWIGPRNAMHYFDSRCRDVMGAANFLNDRSDFQGEQTPFPKTGLKDICHKLGIEVIEGKRHDAVYDCLLAAQAYKALCKEFSL